MSRARPLGKHALVVVGHTFAQAPANGVHLGARLARCINQQQRLAKLNLAAHQRDQIYAESLDVGAHCSWRNGLQSESGGVLSELLALNEADLPAVGLANIAAESA